MRLHEQWLSVLCIYILNVSTPFVQIGVAWLNRVRRRWWRYVGAFTLLLGAIVIVLQMLCYSSIRHFIKANIYFYFFFMCLPNNNVLFIEWVRDKPFRFPLKVSIFFFCYWLPDLTKSNSLENQKKNKFGRKKRNPTQEVCRLPCMCRYL